MIRVLSVILIFLLFSCKEQPKENTRTTQGTKAEVTAVVTLRNVDGKYDLLVNNEKFFIKGAGLEFGDVPALARHGGNSFRTWRTENGKKTALEVLNEAHEHGLLVTMGIEVGRERHGFDYNDTTQVNEQLRRIKKEVLALKDHPALMIWGIGNELNLHYTNPMVWNAVNEISQMIHELDPNHLTTTSLAGLAQQEVTYIKERAPDLDVLSVQMYGDLPDLPRLIREFGWEGPYMVTEWGATGHWEVPTTSWGAPIEENSTIKAANYFKRYQGGIAADSLQCIGSYVFLWGNKQERTPTWYGIFLEDGRETESVDVMHYIWNGNWPVNRTPQIASFSIEGKTAYDNVKLSQGTTYKAIVEVNDYENDPISYKWEILPESTDVKEGGDYEERPKAIEGFAVSEQNNNLTFKTPDKGAYRLFIYPDDGHAHSATANIPFYVE